MLNPPASWPLAAGAPRHLALLLASQLAYPAAATVPTGLRPFCGLKRL